MDRIARMLEAYRLPLLAGAAVVGILGSLTYSTLVGQGMAGLLLLAGFLLMGRSSRWWELYMVTAAAVFLASAVL